MKVLYHGGLCCGIKIIYGFQGNPAYNECKTYEPEWVKDPSLKDSKMNKDKRGVNVSSEESPCPLAFPRQTGLERLKALIKWVKEWRPKGIIEITLTDAYQSYWYPELKKLRFKEVNKFVNSNSGNTVRIFHLKYGQPRKSSKKAPLPSFLTPST